MRSNNSSTRRLFIFIQPSRVDHDSLNGLRSSRDFVNEVLSPLMAQLSAENFFSIPADFWEPVPREVKPYTSQVSSASFQGLLESTQYNGKIPPQLCCPISCQIMNDPIKVSSGQIYDRESLKEYFKREGRNTVPCPINRKMIHISELENKTDKETKTKIKDFIKTIQKIKTCIEQQEKNKSNQNNAENNSPPLNAVTSIEKSSTESKEVALGEKRLSHYPRLFTTSEPDNSTVSAPSNDSPQQQSHISKKP